MVLGAIIAGPPAQSHAPESQDCSGYGEGEGEGDGDTDRVYCVAPLPLPPPDALPLAREALLCKDFCYIYS